MVEVILQEGQSQPSTSSLLSYFTKRSMRVFDYLSSSKLIAKNFQARVQSCLLHSRQCTSTEQMPSQGGFAGIPSEMMEGVRTLLSKSSRARKRSKKNQWASCCQQLNIPLYLSSKAEKNLNADTGQSALFATCSISRLRGNEISLSSRDRIKLRRRLEPTMAWKMEFAKQVLPSLMMPVALRQFDLAQGSSRQVRGAATKTTAAATQGSSFLSAEYRFINIKSTHHRLTIFPAWRSSHLQNQRSRFLEIVRSVSSTQRLPTLSSGKRHCSQGLSSLLYFLCRYYIRSLRASNSKSFPPFSWFTFFLIRLV